MSREDNSRAFVLGFALAKQEMQKRGLASPDDADALALTFARAVAPPVVLKRPKGPSVYASPWV